MTTFPQQQHTVTTWGEEDEEEEEECQPLPKGAFENEKSFIPRLKHYSIHVKGTVN